MAVNSAKPRQGADGRTWYDCSVWVDHPWFLAKVWGKTGSKLYGPNTGADYVDNHKRFALFCKAAIESMKVCDLRTCSVAAMCGPHG